ncbi:MULTISPECIES: hypothetical protein [unclassified Streptomyces]|uniref:hypothetical protein n=1 Tax=unclassified Streptomyces TaxID=2593676 RepID=UPI0035E0C156
MGAWLEHRRRRRPDTADAYPLIKEQSGGVESEHLGEAEQVGAVAVAAGSFELTVTWTFLRDGPAARAGAPSDRGARPCSGSGG